MYAWIVDYTDCHHHTKWDSEFLIFTLDCRINLIYRSPSVDINQKKKIFFFWSEQYRCWESDRQMFHLLFGWSRIKQANKHKNSESFRPRRPDFLFSVFFDVQLFFLSTFFFHSLKLPLHFYSFFFKFFMSIKKTEKIHLTGKTNNRKNWFKISKTHSPSCHRKINPSPDLKVLWQKKELFLVSVKRYFFFL